MRTGYKFVPIKNPDKIMSYWRKEYKTVICIIFSGTIFNAAMPYIAVLQGNIIDTLANGEEFFNIVRACEIFFAATIIVQVLRFMKRYYVRRFANQTSANMRMMIYNNLINLEGSELEKKDTGDLLTRAVADVDICSEGMRKVTTEIFDTGVLLVSYFVCMIAYDVKLTIAAGIFIPAAMFLAQYLKKAIVRFSRTYRTQSSLVANLTYTNIEQQMLLRIHGLEDLPEKEYEDELKTLRKDAIKAGIFENSMQPVYKVISMMGIIFVFFMGGNNVIDGKWSVGTFTAYVTIFLAVALKASRAAKLFNSFQKATVSWKRIKPYFTAYKENKNKCEKIENVYSFAAQKLSFGVIKDISFELKPGEVFGVTGPVACGKTTLARALLGMYDYEGNIKINNKEITSYTQEERSFMISFLGHSPQLLSDTIYENITLGDKGDISKVLKDTCLDTDLIYMPDGINTVIGNRGVRLSGGQQSRLSLARALYRHNNIIILDDPFSAVDAKTEQQIMNNIRSNYSDCIIILISHRVSYFAKTDSVMVIDDDGHGQCGKHENLLKENELYQKIYNLQQDGAVKNNEKE